MTTDKLLFCESDIRHIGSEEKLISLLEKLCDEFKAEIVDITKGSDRLTWVEFKGDYLCGLGQAIGRAMLRAENEYYTMLLT